MSQFKKKFFNENVRKKEMNNLQIERNLRNISTNHQVWTLSGSQFKQNIGNI